MGIWSNLMLCGLYIWFNLDCRPRLQLAFVIGFFQLSHSVLFDKSADVLYFVTAGTIDFITICCLSSMRFSKLNLFLQYVLLAGICFNLIGLVLYWFYFEPLIYNTSIMSLIIIQSWLLLSGDGENERNRDYTWRNSFARFSRLFNSNHSQAKARK